MHNESKVDAVNASIIYYLYARYSISLPIISVVT